MESEELVAGLLAAGDLRAAAGAAVEAYGPEVLGFLVAFLGHEDDASEAFAQSCEDLWIGLPRFEGRCSIRTWFYTLSRNAASRLRRSPSRRPAHNLPLSFITDAAERIRSRTLPQFRTDVKDRLAAIRAALPPDDRALLVLRVDREMSWKDIARVHAPDLSSEEELARTSARLRKRFQQLKEEIRARAREAGLVPDEDP
ncbi:MAG: sigma-70 family RNA polymerase sigma factor [Myxococcales bacterium]|nr:sigma-70 family RNA polymerase sigma factor [Myxococcales bacterium]